MTLWSHDSMTASEMGRMRPLDLLCEEKHQQNIADGLVVETQVLPPPILTSLTCLEPGHWFLEITTQFQIPQEQRVGSKSLEPTLLQMTILFAASPQIFKENLQILSHPNDMVGRWPKSLATLAHHCSHLHHWLQMLPAKLFFFPTNVSSWQILCLMGCRGHGQLTVPKWSGDTNHQSHQEIKAPIKKRQGSDQPWAAWVPKEPI